MKRVPSQGCLPSSQVHPTRFSFCLFPGVLAIFMLSSNNNNIRCPLSPDGSRHGGNDDKSIHDAWMIEEWIEFSESHRYSFALKKCPLSFSSWIGTKILDFFNRARRRTEKY